MEKKFCNECGTIAWHNPRKDKAMPPRCTYCGAPPSSSPQKRPQQVEIINKQVAKARAKRGSIL